MVEEFLSSMLIRIVLSCIAFLYEIILFIDRIVKLTNCVIFFFRKFTRNKHFFDTGDSFSVNYREEDREEDFHEEQMIV